MPTIIKDMFSTSFNGYAPIVVGQQFAILKEPSLFCCCNSFRLVTPSIVKEFFLPQLNVDSLKLCCQLVAKLSVDSSGSFHDDTVPWNNLPANVAIPKFEPFNVHGTDTAYKVILHTKYGYVARRVGSKMRIRVQLINGLAWPFAGNYSMSSMSYCNKHEWETIHTNYISVSAIDDADAQIKVGRGLAMLLQMGNDLK